MPSDNKRVHVFYGGLVQGVGFRFTVESIAERYPVVGFVKNLSDGRVEIVCEGKEKELSSFLEDIRETMRRHISDEELDWEPATSEFTSFNIKF